MCAVWTVFSTKRLGHLVKQPKRSSHLDPLAVYEYGLHGKVDADGVPVTFDERARLEALHQTGLACATITDQHNLEQVVEILVVCVHHQIVGIAARHSHRQVRGDDDGGRAFGMLHFSQHSLSTPSHHSPPPRAFLHLIASILVYLSAPLLMMSATTRSIVIKYDRQ